MAYVRPQSRRSCRSGSTTTSPLRDDAAGKPLVLLAGHLDTVPAAGQPARPDRGRRGARPRRERHERRGRGDDRAGAWATTRRAGARSRFPLLHARGARRPTRARCPASSNAARARGGQLVVVLEPTDNSSMPAASATSTRSSPSTARARTRPGRGRARTRSHAAVEGLAPLARLEPRRRRGRRARVPRGRSAPTQSQAASPTTSSPTARRDAQLPLRAGPLAGRGRGAAPRARRRGEVEILGNSPPAHVAARPPLVTGCARRADSTSSRSRRGRRSPSSRRRPRCRQLRARCDALRA